jgi:hypothetical protein
LDKEFQHDPVTLKKHPGIQEEFSVQEGNPPTAEAPFTQKRFEPGIHGEPILPRRGQECFFLESLPDSRIRNRTIGKGDDAYTASAFKTQ